MSINAMSSEDIINCRKSSSEIFRANRAKWFAKKNGELPIRQHQQVDQISGIQDKINALEEAREIKEAELEVWDLQ